MVENTEARWRAKTFLRGVAYFELSGCWIGTFAYGILHQLANSSTYFYTHKELSALKAYSGMRGKNMCLERCNKW